MDVGRVNDAPPQMRQRANYVHEQSTKVRCSAKVENFMQWLILPYVFGSQRKVRHHVLYDDSQITIFLSLERREPLFDWWISEKWRSLFVKEGLEPPCLVVDSKVFVSIDRGHSLSRLTRLLTILGLIVIHVDVVKLPPEMR